MWFEIPGEPVAKERHRKGKNGNEYTPKKTKDFEALVALKYKQANGKKHLGPVAISVTVWYEIPKSWTKKRKAEALLKPHTQIPDLDNVVKSVLDGLNEVAWDDDKQVSRISASKFWNNAPPKTVVIVEEA